MLNMKRSKWSLGVLLLVALGLLVGLASMATAKDPGDATATPALKSKRSTTAQTSALAPTGTARAELAVPVPNDECTKAPLVADISAAVNATTFHQGNHVAIWLPHPLDNLGTQIEPGLNNVRPQDVYQAALNFSTDKPVCDYDEISPWPGWHERSVWFHYVPEKAGILYLTSYDPMYTRGGEFTTTGAIFRTDYDTVMTVYSTQGGNWCDTWTSMDWAPGVHNGQYDDAYYLNSGFVPPSTFPPGSAFTTPTPEDGLSFPRTLAGYGSLRERGANDYFHPGNHFMGSVDCVNWGFNTDQSAAAVEVVPGQHYYIMVQHYWYPKVVGYCPTDLVLDATFIPHVPTTTWAGPADTTARQTMVEDEKIVDARRVALSLASNGRIWDDIVNFDWLANYHPTGVAGAGLLQWAEFAYDPFNAAYFFYDDMQFVGDGDAGVRTAGNRRADAYWVNKNFFNPSATWDPTVAPPSGTDRTDDFTAFGFASRSAISQMRNYAAEAQFIAQGATWTNTAGTGAQPMNRWFVDTRAVDGEGPLAGQIDSLDLMPDASGYAYSINDIDNDFDFVYEWLTVPEGNAAQNVPTPLSCGNLNTWPPTNIDYNFLSRTGGSVATVAVKAPVTTWLLDRTAIWARTLDPTANLGGSVLSGEVAVHIVNDTIEPLSGALDLGASIVYTYDEDTICAPDNNGMNNPGDTGPTYSMRAYVAPIMGVNPFKILAATVALDDTVNAYNCANGTWDVLTDGLVVPVATPLVNTIDHVGQMDPMVRHSAVIYFIDQFGNLWAVRDEVWNLQAGDPIPNGMPDPTQAANYHMLIAAGAGVGYDLRNAEYMTYNATTGELLISLHGTGGLFGTPAESWESSSKIIAFNDRNTPTGYLGVLIHDPEILINQVPTILAANHQNVGGPGVHNYMFNFDNTTGFGTNGSLETYPDNFPINVNRYPLAPSMPYQPTWNAGLSVGPTDFLGTAVGDANWGDPYDNTAHIFAVGGREDYQQEAISELDPVQKGGADPNFWMSAILDFRADPANLSGGAFAWYDAAYSNLNSWAQDLPYTSRCDGFFHGMTGLSYFHDNSRPDVWFTSTGVIPMNPPITTCFSDRTCEAMHSYCWLTDIVLEWRSWDFAGTGVVGYDGYLMVYTNPLGAGGVYNPDNWTARSIFLDTYWHPEYTALPEVPGPDRAHAGALWEAQRYTYALPCDLSGEAFIRLVAYDKEGNTSFTESKPFRIGVQSVVAMNDTVTFGQVVHRLQPEQKHRVIPVEWTYDPDPCVVGGVQNNTSANECGMLEFDMTFDGGYSWQCMHVLNNADDDWSPITDGTERLAQCIDPNIAQVGLTNVHRLDLVIPDYYVDRYPYTHQVQYRMYYRQYGCDYGPLHNPSIDNCPNLGRMFIYESPKFSIADELGPTIKVNDLPDTQYKGGSVLPITWTNKDGIWDPIGKSCDGGIWDTNPVVKAWFSTDRFDNVATTSYDIQLWQGGALFATIANGLAGNQTSFYWDIPVDYPEGSYQVRVIGHDTTPAGGNTSYYADTVLPYARDIQTNFFNSVPSADFAIVAPACPTITINSPNDNDDFNPGDEVNVAWTVDLPDPGTFTEWVTITGPCGYNETFNLASSYFNWAIPFDACVGSYTITVHAQNGCPTEATAQVVVTVNDIVAPFNVNLTVPATVNQGGTAAITVTATDNVAVTQYLISITGPMNYTYSDTNATGNFNWSVPATAKPGYYTVTAHAKDAAGNISEPVSKVIEVLDVTNPTITLTAPIEGLVVEPNEVVQITWNAYDDDGIAYVQVRIQGQLEVVYDHTFDSVTSSFAWTVPGNAKPGTFSIQATAYDNAGNHTASNVRNVVIADVVAPVITNFKANGVCPANADLGSTVNFTFDATDNVGVTSKVITIQGPGYAMTLPGLSWNIPAGAQPGNYIALATACDAAGNCTESTCVIVVKDGTAPVVSGFTATPSTIVPGGSVKFDWTATDNIAVVAQTLRITGPGGWDNTINVTAAARTYSVSFPKTAALGLYTATITACDATPLCTTATTTFTIADSGTPVVVLTAPINNLLVNVQTPLNITWTAQDNVDIMDQWIVITGPSYNQTFNSTTSAYNWTTPSAAGDYTIKAYAKDYAGNIGESGTVTVRVRVFPNIIVAHKLVNPFRIQVFGSNFAQGCVVTINGTPVDYKFKNGGKLLLKNVSGLCPKGVEVKIQVVNPDGGYSNLFSFTK